MSEAMRLLGEKGVEVARTYVHPIVERSYMTGHVVRTTYVHVYMADRRGMEVGYWTPSMSTLFVFGVPRAVSAEMMEGAACP